MEARLDYVLAPDCLLAPLVHTGDFCHAAIEDHMVLNIPSLDFKTAPVRTLDHQLVQHSCDISRSWSLYHLAVRSSTCRAERDPTSTDAVGSADVRIDALGAVDMTLSCKAISDEHEYAPKSAAHHTGGP